MLLQARLWRRPAMIMHVQACMLGCFLYQAMQLVTAAALSGMAVQTSEHEPRVRNRQ